MTELQKHYEAVLDDLVVNGPNMFIGVYDARLKTSDDFIYGIQAVMEYIASKVGDERHKDFENSFLDNIIASREKAGRQI